MMTKMREVVWLMGAFLMAVVTVCIDGDEYDDEEDM